MRSFRLVPDGTHIRFMHYQYWGYAFSGALILLTLILVPLKGLNKADTDIDVALIPFVFNSLASKPNNFVIGYNDLYETIDKGKTVTAIEFPADSGDRRRGGMGLRRGLRRQLQQGARPVEHGQGGCGQGCARNIALRHVCRGWQRSFVDRHAIVVLELGLMHGKYLGRLVS